jgi:acetyl-CoA synthetase
LPEPDQRYKETYFTAFPGKYFTGDGALRDEVGITELQAVSMTLLSFPHNLGTAPIEILTSIRLLSQQL